LPSILLALDDIGLAIQLEEVLEAGGHQVSVNAARAAGPGDDQGEPHDVVVLSGDRGASTLSLVVERWRAVDPPPGIVVIGTEATRAAADEARATFVAAGAEHEQLLGAVEQAARLRFAGGLSQRLAMRAVSLGRTGDDGVDAVRLVKAAREADIDLVREALRWYAHHYVTATDGVALLREHRALDIPEVELTRRMNGTLTVQSLVKSGVVDGWRAARVIWVLASVGAVTLTPEPPDLSSPERIAVYEARRHLVARRERLAHATYFDVLEITPDASPEQIEHACRILATRYGPRRLAALDLAAITPLVEPLWNQLLQARATLLDWSERGKYNDYVGANLASLKTEWANPDIDAETAAGFFARGQSALVEGKVHQAVSHLAGACRWHPGHPDYEVSLAWARYRADVQADKPKDEVARRERAAAERALLGRRPWPRALTALGLLCVADNDPDAARWHLREALAIDPNLPAARRVLQRL
jgi:hypothetical protein